MPNGHQVAMAIRRAYLSMHRQADAILAPYGVTANQYVILALLAERDQVPQRDLVERAASDPNTIRPVLKTLERKGLVTRKQDPNDGRARCVGLSKKGRQVFEQHRRDSQPFRDRLTAALDPEDAGSFVQYLRQVQTAMTQRSGEKPCLTSFSGSSSEDGQ
ncbi:MAG TPA: MarR family transcriptional regulator [Thermoguttaceae bacterium]|nr:MarR family transcriptional regulator [Thermoguttaceae bacterium]